MKQKRKKEKWGKPKLIVLVRGGQEERVLSTCKHMSIENYTPAKGFYSFCRGSEITVCQDCLTLVSS